MGFSIELSEKSSELGYHLEEPIHLDTDKDWQICLSSFVVYNSINNITKKNNELILIDDNGIHDRVTIPPGTYEVAEIVEQLKMHPKCQEAKFTVIIQETSHKIKVLCKHKKIDFTSRNVSHFFMTTLICLLGEEPDEQFSIVIISFN